MTIWKTTPPTSQDYPIWAYTDDSEDVVLIRSKNDHQPTRTPITWCRAIVPMKPVNSLAEKKFWALLRSTTTTGWLPKDWFLEGYKHGKHCKGTCECNKGQSAKSPFVNPEEYFEEPKESAYDERL